MDKLEHALKEALVRNKDETEKWTKYQAEHEQAIESIKEFGKKLRVDVMVPIGSKAFMPGELYHTNEIMVSHYTGIFSKCSSAQAEEIVKHRLYMAKEHLKSLQTEREMYQNKLDVPHIDGALAGDGEHEIIEEYDEEKEKLWREEHKKRMRVEKLKEAEEKKKPQIEKTYGDIMKFLEDMEMMEELENELETLQVEDDEMLKQLLNGEVQLPPEKERISHYIGKGNVNDSKQTETDENHSNINNIFNDKNHTFGDIFTQIDNLDIDDEQKPSNRDFTNNNIIPNAIDFQSDEETDSDVTSVGDIPELVLQYEKESETYTPSRKIKFFKSKVRQIEEELGQLKIQTQNDLEYKMSRVEIREYLLEYIEILRDEIDITTEEEQFDNQSAVVVDQANDKKNKKRISFAQKDEILLINKNEAASAVSRKLREHTEVDKIIMQEINNMKLKESKKAANVISSNEIISKNELSAEEILIQEMNKMKDIRNKVEQNLKYISENQSQQDFDLVGKIIGSVDYKDKTFNIKFNHTANQFTYPGYNIDNTYENTGKPIIGSPADIYSVFNTYFPIDIQKRQKFYEILQANFHKKVLNKDNKPVAEAIQSSNTDANLNEPITKSILKNKDLVKQEKHVKKEIKTQKKKNKSIANGGFEMIMGDVVENKAKPLVEPEPLVEPKPLVEPEPLPPGNYVDVHAPRKRISRFKEMRARTS